MNRVILEGPYLTKFQKKISPQSIEDFKEDYTGGYPARYDLYIDKDTDLIWVCDKGGGNPKATDISVH